MKQKITSLALTCALLCAGVTLISAPAAAAVRCAVTFDGVDYADDPQTARRQHAFYCRHRLINAKGVPTGKGRVWFRLRAGTTPPARSARRVARQLALYRRLGFWNPRKIEYADGRRAALAQFKTWFRQGYIAVNGGWSEKGKARFR